MIDILKYILFLMDIILSEKKEEKKPVLDIVKMSFRKDVIQQNHFFLIIKWF